MLPESPTSSLSYTLCIVAYMRILCSRRIRSQNPTPRNKQIRGFVDPNTKASPEQIPRSTPAPNSQFIQSIITVLKKTARNNSRRLYRYAARHAPVTPQGSNGRNVHSDDPARGIISARRTPSAPSTIQSSATWHIHGLRISIWADLS